MRPLLAFFALAVVPGWAAAQEKDKKPNYYPFAKGNKWEFTFTVGGKTAEATTEVVKVEEKDGTVTATLETRVVRPDKPITDIISTNAAGMLRLSFQGAELGRPITMMKFPVKPGDTWTEKFILGGGTREAKTTVGEPAEVKVPAGTYKAVPVEMDLGGGTKLTNWYADGVGIVKQTVDLGAVKSTFELTKFTPAK